MKDKTIKNVVLMALFLSLTMLAKKNGIILVPIALAVFAVTILRDKRNYKYILRQAGVFLTISIPLCIIFPIRNFVKFGQGLLYAPDVNFERYANTLKNLLYIPIKGFIEQPFTQDPFTGRNELFADYVLKSSLFGEWRFEGLERIATLLLFVTSALIIILAVYLIVQNVNLLKGKGFIMLLCLILPFGLLLQSRLSFPVVCAQNFRYAGVGLIGVAFCYGHAINKFSNTRFKFLKYIFALITVAFCIISAAFILNIGVAPEGVYDYSFTVELN